MTYREEIWDKAYKRIFELYGENPDIQIMTRFMSEKKDLSHYGVAEYFDELAGICKESLEKYNETANADSLTSQPRAMKCL